MIKTKQIAADILLISELYPEVKDIALASLGQSPGISYALALEGFVAVLSLEGGKIVTNIRMFKS